ncbi:hypothetical protein [Mangrovimonas aestuarii]|uniref:hypothetical protein n=1 Tax=Mangrovimonas aestuarii TaxID=3018443 RepID=UPI002377FFB4|nr:hypothetical protein [Mangrovimonas aestuarii]
MKRVIVDYRKLTPEILRLLTDKFPDGYNDDDIIIFDDHHNQIVEAVEVKTNDTIYLVKVSSKLHYTMTNFDDNKEVELDEMGYVVLNKDLVQEGYLDEEE